MNTSSKIKGMAVGFSLKTAIVIIIFLICALAFIAIADEMVIEKENGFDVWAFNKLKPITNHGTTLFMECITFLGSSYFLLPAYLLIVLIFFLKGNRRYSINIASVGLWSSVVLFFIKHVFKRQRPPDPLITHVAGFSFPSGHSFSSFTFFGLLIFIAIKSRFSRLVKYITAMVFFLLATLIAMSRVYLHVHYASDVVAGFFLATIWLILSFIALKQIDKAIRRNTDMKQNL